MSGKINKRIIAIVGMPGAGKSEAAEYFNTKGIPILRFGDQTDIGLRESGKELTEENERRYRETLRKELGMAAYAIKIKPRIDRVLQEHDIVVLDGLYSWEEYTYLRKQFSGLSLLCIYARPETRYNRLTARSHRSLTKQTARSRDIAELEHLNKGGPIAIADYLVVNEKTKQDFFKQLDTFFLHLTS